MNRFPQVLLCLILVLGLLGSSQAQKAYATCGPGLECVPRHLCDSDNIIIKNGQPVINFRTGKPPNSTTVCDWTEICCFIQRKKVDVPLVVHQDCGHSNPNGLKLTLDNTMRDEAQRFEFPWMVSIRARTYVYSPFHSIGGGALVSTKVVLTTAHRVIEFEENNLVIRAGEWDTDTDKEFLPHVDVVVDRKIIHEEFSVITGINNVALLILKKPLDRAAHIGTICLPRKDTHFVNEQCIVMGWGKKKADSLEYPNILKKVRLPYLNNQQCQPMLRKTQLGRYYELHSSLLCAGGEEGRDACVGDGGSPLVCPLKDYPDRYQLVGLVNFGLGCGQKDVPGIYTNVQMLLKWIKLNLNASYVPPNDYTY